MAPVFGEDDRLISLARRGFGANAEVSGVLLMGTTQTVLFVTSVGFREAMTGKPPGAMNVELVA